MQNNPETDAEETPAIEISEDKCEGVDVPPEPKHDQQQIESPENTSVPKIAEEPENVEETHEEAMEVDGLSANKTEDTDTNNEIASENDQITESLDSGEVADSVVSTEQNQTTQVDDGK